MKNDESPHFGSLRENGEAQPAFEEIAQSDDDKDGQDNLPKDSQKYRHSKGSSLSFIELVIRFKEGKVWILAQEFQLIQSFFGYLA